MQARFQQWFCLNKEHCLKSLGKSPGKNEKKKKTSFFCGNLLVSLLLVSSLRWHELDTDLAFTWTPLAALDQLFLAAFQMPGGQFECSNTDRKPVVKEFIYSLYTCPRLQKFLFWHPFIKKRLKLKFRLGLSWQGLNEGWRSTSNLSVVFEYHFHGVQLTSEEEQAGWLSRNSGLRKCTNTGSYT